MYRILTAFLLCAAAQAATLSVNLSVSASVSLTASNGNYPATGTATLTGGISDTGTFTASIPETALASASATIPYTLTLKNGTMAGNLTLPIGTILTSGSGTGSATVTSASGSYSGDTGTFPTIQGTGSIGLSGLVVNFTGNNGTITTGGTAVAPPPTLTAVEDAGSYTPNIAPGSIFVVKGANMSASGYTPLAFPLPTTSGGTSISFAPASGTGAATQAYLIYTYNENGVNQLAAVLPSTVTPGNYNVTVTYGGTPSSPLLTTVTAQKFGIITQDSTGSGLASAQILPSYALDRLTTGNVSGYAYGIQPAHPGDTVVVYGTGLGAVTGGDNIGSAGFNFLPGLNVQVNLGGTIITPLYAGRTPGASGLDQISFTIPSSFSATACAVTLQVLVNGVGGMATTLSVAPGGAPGCSYAGLTYAQLQALDQGGAYTTGGFDIEQITATVPTQGTVKDDIAGGTFSQVTGFELGAASSTASFSSTTIGACTVTQSTSGGSVTSAGGAVTYLDAGTVTLTGPTGTLLSNTVLPETSNIYSLSIGEEGLTIPGSLNGKILAGTYTLANTGGKDVGKFSPNPVSITLGTPLTITGGLPATVTESAGLTLNWTGGNASDVVEIAGGASVTTGTAPNTVTTSTSFFCLTTAGPGTFTVPASVLTQVPKVTSTNGSLEVFSTPTPVPFTAPLTAGGTVNAAFSALLGTGGSVAYQ